MNQELATGVNRLGLRRMYAVECDLFRCKGLRDVLGGWQYFDNACTYNFTYDINNGLPFSRRSSVRKPEYQSVYGPSMFHPDISIYSGCNTRNVSMALQRITGAREKEEVLTKNNRIISPLGGKRRLSRFIESYYRKIKERMLPVLEQLNDNLIEQINLAYKPHVKRKVRIQAIKELLNARDMINSLFTKNIMGKIKIPEFAKRGKRPRLLGDYSTEGSLLAAFLVPILKNAFAEPVDMGYGVIRFVYSTDQEQLDRIFTECNNSDVDQYIFFSDDMCCRLMNERGEFEWMNLDISSCDASNSGSVFDRVSWFFTGRVEHKELVDRAVKQCLLPYVIRNPVDPSEYVRCKPNVPIEFSGTQLTTLLNNVASSAISCSIMYSRRLYNFTGSDWVSNAANAVGYNITIDRCEYVEDVQFLKHSFWLDEDGKMNSFTNLGTYVRCIGSCWMDLPYSRKRGENLRDAAIARNREVLTGFRNCGSNPVYRSMLGMPGARSVCEKDYSVIRKSVHKEFHMKSYFNTNGLRKDVPDISVCRRYRMDESELACLSRVILKLDVGDCLVDQTVVRILGKDYGYRLDGCSDWS